MDGTLLGAAEDLARLAHQDQRRKGDGTVPYFVHLESVVRRLRHFGVEDEHTLAAAYLHDLLEDQPAFAGRLRAEFPPEIVETVEMLSEKKLDERGERRPKAARFHDYAKGLRSGTPAALRAIPISCADKLDNVRSLLADERRGTQILIQLQTRPGQHAEQLAVMRSIYAPVVPAPMLVAFDQAVRDLTDYIQGWLPGRALAIAASAHLGQRDKAGAPYALHPLRLALRAETPEEQMAAALHDVVEDTTWTLERLAAEGFPSKVIAAIDHLTRREGESYEQFIERAITHPIARKVKLYDLEDNMDPRRLVLMAPRDLGRIERYHRARSRILEVIARERAPVMGPRAPSLHVRLVEESVAQVRSLAVHADLRGDHVTLAHSVSKEGAEAFIPGGYAVGALVPLDVVGVAEDDKVQALVIEIAGSSVRPWDRGTLHVTVSKAPWAKASDSNAMLASTSVTPLALRLEGIVAWDEPSL
jgi:hypothetical protein